MSGCTVEEHIWRTFLPPKIYLLVWKIIRRRIATSKRLNRRGIQTGGVCLSCIQGSFEDENHIFMHSQNAQNLWSWVLNLIGEDVSRFLNISELIKWTAKLPKKPMLSKHCCAGFLQHLGAVVYEELYHLQWSSCSCGTMCKCSETVGSKALVHVQG